MSEPSKSQIVGVYNAAEPSLYSVFSRAQSDRRKAVEFYNSLAETYNAAQLKDVILLSLPAARNRVGNLSNILENRGLVRGVDFEVAPVSRDASGALLPKSDRKVALQRLTAAQMKSSS